MADNLPGLLAGNKRKRGRPRIIPECSINSMIGSSSGFVESLPPPRNEFQNLPCEKNSKLWPTIESMEIFQKLPQNPHFSPLADVDEVMCEGVAIGLIVSFTNVVDKAYKLKFNYSKESTQALMRPLSELERYGFDVVAIRDRVSVFREMKEKEEALGKDVGMLDFQNSLLHQKVEEMQKELNEMGAKLNEVLERKTSKMQKWRQ